MSTVFKYRCSGIDCKSVSPRAYTVESASKLAKFFKWDVDDKGSWQCPICIRRTKALAKKPSTGPLK